MRSMPRHPGAMSPQIVAHRRVVLDLEPAQDSIRGRIVDGDDAGQQSRSFEGWLELSALLDGLRPKPERQDPNPNQDARP